jgi:hypothetical protein
LKLLLAAKGFPAEHRRAAKSANEILPDRALVWVAEATGLMGVPRGLAHHEIAQLQRSPLSGPTREIGHPACGDHHVRGKAIGCANNNLNAIRGEFQNLSHNLPKDCVRSRSRVRDRCKYISVPVAFEANLHIRLANPNLSDAKREPSPDIRLLWLCSVPSELCGDRF